MARLTPILIGAAVAGVALLAAGLAVPSTRRVLRPALKAGMKTLVMSSIAARRQIAELGEAWDDLVAEVGAEMAAESSATAAAATATAEGAKGEEPLPTRGKRRTRKKAAT